LDYDKGLFQKLVYTKLVVWDYQHHAYEISPRLVSEETLIPGQPSNRHLSIRSAQNIFNKALEKAPIQKQLSIHSLVTPSRPTCWKTARISNTFRSA
jgi:hypothetical protein